jgi:hypothetical protein
LSPIRCLHNIQDGTTWIWLVSKSSYPRVNFPFWKTAQNTIRKHKIFLKGKYFLHLPLTPRAWKGGKSNKLFPSQVMPFFSHLSRSFVPQLRVSGQPKRHFELIFICTFCWFYIFFPPPPCFLHHQAICFRQLVLPLEFYDPDFNLDGKCFCGGSKLFYSSILSLECKGTNAS